MNTLLQKHANKACILMILITCLSLYLLIKISKPVPSGNVNGANYTKWLKQYNQIKTENQKQAVIIKQDSIVNDSLIKAIQAWKAKRIEVIKEIPFYIQPQVHSYLCGWFADSIKVAEIDSIVYNCFDLEQSKKLIITNENLTTCDTMLYLTQLRCDTLTDSGLRKDTIIRNDSVIIDKLVNNLYVSESKRAKQSKWLLGSGVLNVVQLVWEVARR